MRSTQHLPDDEAHIWVVRPAALDEPGLLAEYESLLTVEERARRDRFVFEKGKYECFVTRALIRTTLSRYVDVDPRTWRFGSGEHGKPFIAEPAEYGWLSFNLSHTDGLIACIVCRDLDVGVDVEDAHRSSQTVEIADRFFAEDEVDALRALPAQAQRERFFVYWTLKEAYIKARGLGLAIPLGHFCFEVHGPSPRISFAAQLADTPTHWQFGLWRPSDRHQGAYAIRRGARPPVRVVIRPSVPLRD